MATSDSGESFPSGVSTTDWNPTSTDTARDRRAAGEDRDMKRLVRETAVQRLGTEKNRASDTIESLAGAIRNLTQQLRDEGQTGLAEYITKAADGVEHWASELRRQDLQDTMRRLETFARQQPALFLGVAFGAGVLLSRFLKSSPPPRAASMSSGVL